MMQARQIRVQFTKMTGAGNDFILVDNRTSVYQLNWERFAVATSDRRYGVGADGLLVLEPSTIADFKMMYFNADGSSGGMCGNGGRCASAYAMRGSSTREVRFLALDYIYAARQSAANISLKMKNPSSIILKRNFNLHDVILPVHSVDTGAPHVVLFFDELPPKLQSMVAKDGLRDIGRTIRYHPKFSPSGTNVNLIQFGEDGVPQMQTYERGVEAETLACGTGAAACAVILSLHRGMIAPINMRTQSGEILTVNFRRELDNVSDVELVGSARFVFTGEILFEEEGGSGD